MRNSALATLFRVERGRLSTRRTFRGRLKAASEAEPGDGRLCMRGRDGSPFAHVAELGEPAFLTVGFRAASVGDLMRGHAHLKVAGAQPEWGVGRHFLGGQVFDDWRGPWGFTLEHWTDGDLFIADDPPRKATIAELMGVQWGMPMPPSMTG